MGNLRIVCLTLVIFLTLAGCFGGPKNSSGVTGYRDQRVAIKGAGNYSVGELSADWRRLPVRAKTIAFYNDTHKTTISTDAFCGKEFEDLALRNLTNNLMAGIEKRKIASEQDLFLDGRGALRTVSTGFVDGVPVQVDAVVLKKNNCTFDFICVTTPGSYHEVSADFERFFSGFHYE